MSACKERRRSLSRKPRQLQRGMAIISALFILLVLAVLGAFAVHVSSMQHVGSAQDVQSIRTYLAARAGIEWALWWVQPANGGSCAASTDLTLPGASFAGIVVTVQCTGATALYQIRAIACNQPVAGACPNTGGFNSLYSERMIDVRLRTD